MSEKFSTDKLIGMVIGFLLIAILLPIGLDALLTMVLPEGIDSTIETLIMVVLPLMAVLGIVLTFIPKFSKD